MWKIHDGWNISLPGVIVQVMYSPGVKAVPDVQDNAGMDLLNKFNISQGVCVQLAIIASQQPQVICLAQ